MLLAMASAGGMVFCGVLYVEGLIPVWACIVTNAVLASFLHEIEHDLIHDLYFKEKKRVQNLLFWLVWLSKLNSVDPWLRRDIHLLHHRKSGHVEDVEERFIGNGMTFGVKRLLTMVDPMMALMFQGPELLRDASAKVRSILDPRKIGPYLPLYQLLWYSFLLLSLLSAINRLLGPLIRDPAWFIAIHDPVNTVAVIYMIPSWIRQTSLQAVSSNMHYFGDVDGLFNETQVLDSWLVFPLHLFCFNFGATHCIHHFVVKQPFYLRQAVALFVRPALRKYEIRFNDLRSILEGNRHPSRPSGQP